LENKPVEKLKELYQTGSLLSRNSDGLNFRPCRTQQQKNEKKHKESSLSLSLSLSPG